MCDCRCKCKFKDAVCNDVIFVSHSFRSKCNNFSEFLSLSRTFNTFFLVSLHEFRCSVVCVIFRAFVSISLYLFHLHYSLFVTFVFCSFDSTMIQPYFSPQFLSTMFSFVLLRVKRSSLQCFSTILCVLRSPLTQQFSLAVTM